jgi:hypothetical protein
MSPNEARRLNLVRGESLQSGEPVMPNAPLSVDASDVGVVEVGTADESGVSGQTLDVETAHPTVKSDITERQAVEVRPMRYVLFIGLGLAIVALLVVWVVLH